MLPALTPTTKIDPGTGTPYDYYSIEARAARKQIIPGLWTTIWGYNGLFPGPVIVATQGRPVVLRMANSLPEDIVVHLHGGHIPVTEDGHTMDFIHPGGYREYRYTNNQHASTIMYHDHAMSLTGKHVWYGLVAPYVIVDQVEAGLPLPSGNYDVPLVVQDRSFNADGSFNYPVGQRMGMMQSGAYGDVMLVNGAVQPYFRVANRKYRFRIVNGCNARLLQLSLNTGQPFVQIGGDGGLLPAPAARSSMILSPGERSEVVIDFSAYRVGTQIILKNLLGSGRTVDVLRFDVDRKENDPSTVPSTLRSVPRIPVSSAVRTRTFTLGMNMSGFTINGLVYDCMRVDFTTRLGSTEIWEFVNPMGMWHCMHMHDIMCQVVDRDGAPPQPWEMGWKDVFYVPGKSRVRVIGTFNDYSCDPDPMATMQCYMLHCHILEHDDAGMMLQFKVLA